MICRRCKMDGTSQEVCEHCQRITTLEAQLKARDAEIAGFKRVREINDEYLRSCYTPDAKREIGQLQKHCLDLRDSISGESDSAEHSISISFQRNLKLAQLRARCVELATQYADVAALQLADESTVVQLRARVGELEAENAELTGEWAKQMAADIAAAPSDVDCANPQEPNDG